MDTYKILVVEDDPYLGMMVQELLTARQFQAVWEQDGVKGFDRFVEFQPDLCLLDVNLPQKDGFSLAKEIKQIDQETPIIFLTAKSLKEDVLEGFAIGADDYVKKPFSMEELIARIQAILRRSQAKEVDLEVLQTFQLGSYEFNYTKRMLSLGDSEQVLTHREADLLLLFCQRKNQLLDRTIALKKLWKDDSYFNARSMDVHITNLRKKLKEDESVQIVNVRGRGYKLLCIKEAVRKVFGQPF